MMAILVLQQLRKLELTQVTTTLVMVHQEVSQRLHTASTCCFSNIQRPQNAPDATGPSGGTDDDFTNKSSLVPAGTAPGSLLDPQSVGFTNTVKNSGTDPGVLKLEPTPPTVPGDLPNGTKVTITYNSQSAVYTYNNGAFT